MRRDLAVVDVGAGAVRAGADAPHVGEALRVRPRGCMVAPARVDQRGDARHGRALAAGFEGVLSSPPSS